MDHRFITLVAMSPTILMRVDPTLLLGVPRSADRWWDFDDTLEDPGKVSDQLLAI